MHKDTQYTYIEAKKSTKQNIDKKIREKKMRDGSEKKCPLGDEDQIYRKLNYMNNIILVNKNQDLK